MCQIWEFRPKLLNIGDISPRIRMHNSLHQHCLFFFFLKCSTNTSWEIPVITAGQHRMTYLSSASYGFSFTWCSLFVLAARGLRPCAGFALVAVSRDYSLSRCRGFSCCRAWALGSVSFCGGATRAQQVQVPGSRAQA